MATRDPFAGMVYDTPRGPIQTMILAADDRMRIVRTADADTLRAIVAMPVGRVQKSVRAAAERRLRRLESAPLPHLSATCIGCGCTDAHACVASGVPCHWLEVDYVAGRGVCSECEPFLPQFKETTR